MLKKSALSLVVVGLLFGCKSPDKVYFKEIEKLGVIPFKAPVTSIGTGTMLRGTPNYVTPIAPPDACFPDEFNGQPTNLRWTSGVAIPASYRHMRFDFNMKLNSLIATGTPGIQFNMNMTKVQKVELDIREAEFEMVDQIALKDFFQNGMSQDCKDILNKYPFILEALRVTAMSFVFYDSFGGKMNLTSANIGDFAILGADVQWYIEQGYKLVVVSPKYVGYRLAQLRPEDEGFVKLTSSKVKNDAYVWHEMMRR
jgi:hypothetical protein